MKGTISVLIMMGFVYGFAYYVAPLINAEWSPIVTTTIGTAVGTAIGTVAGSRRRFGKAKTGREQDGSGELSEEIKDFMGKVDELAKLAPHYAALFTILLPIIPVAIIGLAGVVFMICLNWMVALWPW